MYFSSGTDRVVAYGGCEERRIKKMRNTHRILVGKPEWSRPLGRLSANERRLLKYIRM